MCLNYYHFLFKTLFHLDIIFSFSYLHLIQPYKNAADSHRRQGEQAEYIVSATVVLHLRWPALIHRGRISASFIDPLLRLAQILKVLNAIIANIIDYRLLRYKFVFILNYFTISNSFI